MWRILETTNHYLNYGDTLLENIIFTDWARGKFSGWLLSLCAMILRLHFISAVCAWFTYSFWVDFILHTAISIVCTFYRHLFYRVVAVFEPASLRLVNYLLDNYTLQNYRWWKRGVLLGMCVYGILGCLLIEITSELVIVYIIEYMITFIVVDVIENKAIDKLVEDYQNRPRHVIHASFNIDEDYFDTAAGTPAAPTNTPIKRSKSVGTVSMMLIDDYKT